VFGRLFLAIDHLEGFLIRHIKDSDLARGGDVTDVPALNRRERCEIRMRETLLGVPEREQASREIRTRIALEFQQNWFGARLKLNPAA
jgi:hypothetical protein